MIINTPLLSIVVIFFNEQELLARCLDSILQQSFQNFQVILVNDGSTDNSLQIANRYQSTFKDCAIVNIPNSGHGVARNEGMKLVHGEYVTFLDADDTFTTNALETFTNQIHKTNADLIISDFYAVDENQKNPLKTKWFPHYKNIMDSKEVVHLFYHEGITEPVWAKAFKSRIAKEISFKENMLFEDRCFVLESVLKSATVSFLNKKLVYNYRRANSTTRKTLENNRITDSYELFLHEKSILIRYNLFDQYKEKLYKNALDYFMDTFIIQLVDLKQIKNLKELRLHFNTTFSKYITNLKTDNIVLLLKDRIAVRLLVSPKFIGWSLANFIIKMTKSNRFKQIAIIKNNVKS